jgi:hypothetical protein
LDLVAAQNGEARKAKLNKFPVHNLKLKILMATVLALQLCVTFADPVSDRIHNCSRKRSGCAADSRTRQFSTVWDATAKQLEDHFRLHIIQVAGFAGLPARANAAGAVLQPTVDAIRQRTWTESALISNGFNCEFRVPSNTSLEFSCG